ncbi:MAG: response regulator transcription factor [Magnetospirillum sp.]|nr:MAG: response regulator transcription factor [Magnetospirillum sp.]
MILLSTGVGHQPGPDFPEGRAVRVLIADDHPLFRDALRHVVAQSLDGAECIEACDFGQITAVLAEDELLDLILLDLNMPGMDGFTGLLRLREDLPDTPIIVVSASEEVDVVEQALACGAAGFIPKSSAKERMREAVNLVMSGEVFRPEEILGGRARVVDPLLEEKLGSLTHRQRMVLSLLARGRSNKQIAYELDVTNTTVKAHMTAILRKLKVTSRTQAVIVARQIGRF